MLYEKLDLKFDIARLQQHLEEYVFSLPVYEHAQGYHGGWGVTSADGSYNQGWERIRYFTLVNGVWTFNEEKAKAAGFKPVKYHNVPTEICTGYMAEVLRMLEERGFQPRRARINLMRAGRVSRVHQDYPSGLYAVRIHIPIITNPSCFFCSPDEEAHMPADGSGYLVTISRPHYIYNQGASDRYHFVAEVWDTRSVSQHHRYPYGETIHWDDYIL